MLSGTSGGSRDFQVSQPLLWREKCQNFPAALSTADMLCQQRPQTHTHTHKHTVGVSFKAAGEQYYRQWKSATVVCDDYEERETRQGRKKSKYKACAEVCACVYVCVLSVEFWQVTEAKIYVSGISTTLQLCLQSSKIICFRVCFSVFGITIGIASSLSIGKINRSCQ